MYSQLRVFLTYLPKAIWLYAPGLISVIAGYFLLMKLPQGQDLIIRIGESPGAFVFSTISVLVWSFFIWYSSKLVSYMKVNKGATIPAAFYRHVPRLLGYNALVTVQLGILTLPTMLNLSAEYILIFIVLHTTLYFLLSHLWTEGYTYPVTKWILILILAGNVALMFWLCWSHRYVDSFLRHQFYLPIIALGLFVLQILMVWFFILRRRYINEKESNDRIGDQECDYIRLFGREVLKVPKSSWPVEQLYFNVFNSISLIGGLVFASGILFIGVADTVGPLAFALLAFGILVGLANMVGYQSVRRNFNFHFLIVLWVIVIGWFDFADLYRVRLIKAESRNIYSNRPDLKTYFNRWVTHRQEDIAQSSEFPVYIILSDGGASRSGYWVASVLSAWEDLPGRDSVQAFSNHLLCLSGTSGGSVGNVTFYALLKNKQHESTLKLTGHAQQFLRTDFLTYCIAHYFGSDLLRHAIPIPFTDRAAALEKVLEQASDEPLDGAFRKPVSEVIDTSGKLPILFLNTTEVQGGTPAVVSSILLQNFSKRMDVLTEIDSTGKDGDGDIRLSTATILSARFPYISPAGSIHKYYFVDGGYFDNSGSGVVHEMLQELQRIMEQDTVNKVLYNKLKFHLVHVTNTPLDTIPLKTIHPLVNDLAAPLLTVLNTYSSQTTVNDQRLINYFREKENMVIDPDINLYKKYANNGTVRDSVHYPMNWVISDYNLQRMNKRLRQEFSGQ
jgi:hypothetical protein